VRGGGGEDVDRDAGVWDHRRVRDDLGESQFVADSPEEPLVRVLRRHNLTVDQNAAGITAALAVLELPSDVVAFPGQLPPATVLRPVLLHPVGAFLREELA
jgi:hypothetical protein